MALPYEGATSGQRAIEEIKKILRSFDCENFASGDDFKNGEVFIQFRHRGRDVYLKASAKGYAQAWLKENPWTNRKRMTRQEYEKKALEIGSIAVYSILRDWVKGQITAVECGIMTFEAAFLANLMLPSGERVIDKLVKQKQLPNLEGDKSDS